MSFYLSAYLDSAAVVNIRFNWIGLVFYRFDCVQASGFVELSIDWFIYLFVSICAEMSVAC